MLKLRDGPVEQLLDDLFDAIVFRFHPITVDFFLALLSVPEGWDKETHNGEPLLLVSESYL